MRAGDGGDLLLESFDRDSVQAERARDTKKGKEGGRREAANNHHIHPTTWQEAAAAGVYSQNEIGGLA